MGLENKLDKRRDVSNWLTWLIAYGTILGYWCNLPIIKTGIFGGYNEFRIYDVTFSLLIFNLLVNENEWRKMAQCLKSDSVLKPLFRFSLWASLMTVPTIITTVILSKLTFIGMTIIFLYHLWGFLLFGGFISVYFRGRGYQKLLRWFLILSTSHLCIYYGQVSGVIGNLWPEVYQAAYGEDSMSGTVGPNRITPGMMTLLGLVASVFVLLKPIQGRLVRSLAGMNVLLAFPAIIMIGSRTTFAALLIFIITFVFFHNIKLVPLLLVLVPFLGFGYRHLLGDDYKQRMERNIEYNNAKLSRGGDISDLGVVDGFENLGNGRAGILKNYVPYLASHPYIIPFGSGFNNRLFASKSGAASAHNIYLSLINEVGVVGLFLYFQWLVSYLKIGRRFKRVKAARSTVPIMVSCVVAMLFSMFAGEHIYVYRPLFAIMGTFILVMQFMKISMDRDKMQKLIANSRSKIPERRSCAPSRVQ